MAGKIIVAGHICLDITPVFSPEKAQPLSSVLIPGKLVQMKDVNISTGGAVANTGPLGRPQPTAKLSTPACTQRPPERHEIGPPESAWGGLGGGGMEALCEGALREP